MPRVHGYRTAITQCMMNQNSLPTVVVSFIREGIVLPPPLSVLHAI